MDAQLTLLPHQGGIDLMLLRIRLYLLKQERGRELVAGQLFLVPFLRGGVMRCRCSILLVLDVFHFVQERPAGRKNR